MARQGTTVTIGTEAFTARCPIPRSGIGLIETIALTLRGWRDARRNLGVADDEHTHSLWRLEAFHRRGETEVVRRVDAALSAVDRELAPLEALLALPAATVPEPPSHADLVALPIEQRGAWAAAMRRSQVDAVAAGEADRSRDAAARRIPVLHSIREGLAVEGDDVRRQWREAYAMRAARYTRARFSRWGAVPTATPAVAEYRASDAPTVMRRVAEHA